MRRVLVARQHAVRFLIDPLRESGKHSAEAVHRGLKTFIVVRLYWISDASDERDHYYAARSCWTRRRLNNHRPERELRNRTSRRNRLSRVRHCETRMGNSVRKR